MSVSEIYERRKTVPLPTFEGKVERIESMSLDGPGRAEAKVAGLEKTRWRRRLIFGTRQRTFRRTNLLRTIHELL